VRRDCSGTTTITAQRKGSRLPPPCGDRRRQREQRNSHHRQRRTLFRNSYPNKPCVSVTVCAPGTATCQTINDIILDTGSFGLRIFKQVLTVLPPATGSLAECVQFGTARRCGGRCKRQTSSWEMNLRSRSRFTCSIPRSVPSRSVCRCGSESGRRRIQRHPGVGLFIQDCGTGCANFANNGLYFLVRASCSGTTVRFPVRSRTLRRFSPGQQRRVSAAPERPPRRDILGQRQADPRIAPSRTTYLRP